MDPRPKTAFEYRHQVTQNVQQVIKLTGYTAFAIGCFPFHNNPHQFSLSPYRLHSYLPIITYTPFSCSKSYIKNKHVYSFQSVFGGQHNPTGSYVQRPRALPIVIRSPRDYHIHHHTLSQRKQQRLLKIVMSSIPHEHSFLCSHGVECDTSTKQIETFQAHLCTSCDDQHDHEQSHTNSHSHGHSHGHSHNLSHDTHQHSHRHGHGHSHGHSHAIDRPVSNQNVLTFSTLITKLKQNLFSRNSILLIAQFLLAQRDNLSLSITCALSLTASFILTNIPAVMTSPFAFVATIFFIFSIVCTGLPALVQSCNTLFKYKTLNVDVLMTVAAFLSIATGSLFEGALLMVLFMLSSSSEKAVTEKARGDLDSLSDILPEIALKIVQDNHDVHSPSQQEDKNNHSVDSSWMALRQTINVPVAQLQKNDLILVRAGEISPCDGIVFHGSAFVTLEHVTGESEPRSIQIGDELPAGSKTIDGALAIRATKVGAESTIARIVRLVTEAQQNRPKLQRFIDRFGNAYAKVVLCTAILIATMAPVFAFVLHLAPISYLGKMGSLSRALAFLVAASPCALVIGAPVAYLSALSVCSRRGVLVKGGARAIEASANVNHVVFDKTGTLTTGDPRVVEIDLLSIQVPALTSSSSSSQTNQSKKTGFEALSEQEMHKHFMSTLMALEKNSTHPLAKAVIDHAKSLGCESFPVSDFQAIAGHGLKGRVSVGALGQHTVYAGRLEFVQNSCQLDETTNAWLQHKHSTALDHGESVVIMVIPGMVASICRFEDRLRPNTRSTLKALKQRNLRISVLSGDNENSVKRVADELQVIDQVYSNLTPERKYEILRTLDGNAIMVGDGINDAPAMAAASTGVAMGFGSATAVQASDIILARPDGMADLVWYLRKAAATQRIVYQNVTFALSMMVMAAVPAVFGIIPLWLAVIMHEGGTILVGMNALRLFSDKAHR